MITLWGTVADLVDPKLIVDATGSLGFPTVAALILLLTVCGILLMLAVYLVKFLANIVQIRREIVAQVTQSRTELSTLTLELKGLRSDTRELFKLLYYGGLLGRAMSDAASSRERFAHPIKGAPSEPPPQG